MVLTLAPFILGEEWGTIWVFLNYPLSFAMKKNSLWRLGIPVYVGVVAFFNALIVYFVSYLIVKWAKARALRKQRE